MRRLVLFFLFYIAFLFPLIAQSEISGCMETVSSVTISFENDFWEKTDRYFTNGINFYHTDQFYSKSPINFLFIPFGKPGEGVQEYGIGVIHNMYTPSNVKDLTFQAGDRPFASYLVLEEYKIWINPEKKFRIRSEFQLGLIGSYAFGEEVQNFVHKITPSKAPLGWDKQVDNDLVVNYNLHFSKGQVVTRNFEWILNGGLQLGTLYSNYSLGMGFRAGKLNPYFESLVPASFWQKGKWHFALSYDIAAKYIFYDATLQGGMIFNRDTEYALSKDQIMPWVLSQKIGLSVIYKGHEFVIEQSMLSPEFKSGHSHNWLGIQYRVWF